MTELHPISRLRVDCQLGISVTQHVSAMISAVDKLGIELVIELNGAEILVRPTPEQRHQAALGQDTMRELKSLDLSDKDAVLFFMLKLDNCRGSNISPQKVVWKFISEGGYRINAAASMPPDYTPEQDHRSDYAERLISCCLCNILEIGYLRESLVKAIREFRNSEQA